MEEVKNEPDPVSKRILENNVYSPLSTQEMEEAGNNGGPKTMWDRLKKSLLPVLTVVSVVSGVVVGLILRFNASSKWTEREVMYIQFPGDLFLRMLKAMVIPLMVASVTSAVGSLDLSLSKKIGSRAVLYYMTTTFIAVVEGIVLVILIHPGRENLGKATKTGVISRPVTTADTLLDLVRNMFPPNLIQSCIAQYRTVLVEPTAPANVTGNWTIPDIKDWSITGEYTPGSNVLGLIVFSIVHGIAIGKLGKTGKPLLNFFISLGESVMLMTNWILWLSPIGVFFLVVAKILEAASFAAMVGQLGLYFLTVIIGLFIHGFIVVPGIYIICTKTMPFRFLANMGQAIITAFATGSSAATMSVTLACLEEKNHIDTRVTRFVIPIGATINMDGTALYEAVAVIFISQLRNMSLTLGQLVAISIAATMASIGAAAIPQAGLVTMVMVLDTVGLPAEDISLIFAVDWLLDRCRTTVNVLGDAIGAGIVDHISKRDLEKLPKVSTN